MQGSIRGESLKRRTHCHVLAAEVTRLSELRPMLIQLLDERYRLPLGLPRIVVLLGRTVHLSIAPSMGELHVLHRISDSGSRSSAVGLSQ